MKARSHAGELRNLLMRCPKCGSHDVHSSRAKGARDAALRFVGVAPKRCTACGWRGYRPRFLFHPKQRAAAPFASRGPVPEIDIEAEAAWERSMRRQRRLRGSYSRRRRARTLQAFALALALGAAAGLGAFAFSGG